MEFCPNVIEEVKIMKTKIIGIIVIMLLTATSGLSVAVTINENISYNISNVNNLFNPNPINVLIDLDINGIAYGHELLWKANTTGTNYEESAVAYVDGIAYIGSCSTHGQGHDKVFAVDTSDGQIIWSNYTGPGYVGPVIDNDVIYIGSCTHGEDPDNEYMYAFDRYTGDQIWSVPIYGGIAESVQYDDNKIYFCSSFGGKTIYALNKDDGSIDWTYYTGFNDCCNKPMLKDNALYVAVFDYFEDFGNYFDGELIKLDTTDGSKIWKITLSAGPWDNSITSDSDGRLFLALYGEYTMNAYSEYDGSLLWTYPLHGYSLSFNAYHNGVVYISDTSGYVYALDSTDGTLIWENKIGNCIDISSPTISGGLIFIGTRDGSNGAFFALEESTGEILWKYTIGASITAPPSIVDGMMLCGTDDWDMYAFNFGIGGGDWLLHRYDSLNTAYSPNGLTTWQYVEADCSTNNDITACTIKNYYDHGVNNIILKLDFSACWYDCFGNLLKSKSDFYTIDSLSSLSSIGFVITKNHLNNLPPNAPAINGRKNGNAGTSYKYKFTSIDSDGDDILEYIINWDDGSEEERIFGPFVSGSAATASHTWAKQGTYVITAKAKDINGLIGPEGTLQVTMPRIRVTLSPHWLRFIDIFPVLQILLNLKK